MEVAIQKCPYCKAIIDEGEEYCSNCGTKLLFEEDEFIEEEIPGEKIVEEEVREGNPKPAKDNPTSKKKAAPRKKGAKTTSSAKKTKTAAASKKKAAASLKKKSETPATKKRKSEPAAKKTRKKSVKTEEAVILAEEIEEEAVEEVPDLPEQVPEFEDFPPPEAEETDVDLIPDGDEIQDQESEFEPDIDQDEDISSEIPGGEDFTDFPPGSEPEGEAPSFDDEIAPVEDFMQEKAEDVEIEADSPEIDAEIGEGVPEFIDDQIAAPRDAPEIDEQWKPEEGSADEEEIQFTTEEQTIQPPEQEEEIEFQPEDDEEEAVEKEKIEIEKFLDTLKKERQEVKENGVPPTGELPPWAASMKEGQDKGAVLDEEEIPGEALEQPADAFEGAETEIPIEESLEAPPSSPPDEFPIDEFTPNEIPVDDDSLDEPAQPDEMPGDAASEEAPDFPDEIPIDDDSLDEPAQPDEMPGDEISFEDTAQQDEAHPQGEVEELPETVDQQVLLFDEQVESAQKESAKKKKPRPPRPSISFSVRARIFDILFIAGLWMISLWIASWVAEVTMVQLIKSSILFLLCYYIALLAIYFFFFLFFLRETLGDTLFSLEE